MWYQATTLVLVLWMWLGMELTLQKRARARIPWGATDNTLLSVWCFLVVEITLFTWPGGQFAGSAAALIYAPLAGACVQAHQSLPGLFDADRQAARPSGLSFVSVLHARLARVTERELGILPRFLGARALHGDVDPPGQGAAAALDEFLTFYAATRFAGGDITADDQRRWREQFTQMRKLVVKDLRRKESAP